MMINISEKNFEKYSRQIMMDKIGVSGQKKIMKSSICIIGCGGLGTTTAQYLAMTGVGKILLIDFDNISLLFLFNFFESFNSFLLIDFFKITAAA